MSTANPFVASSLRRSVALARDIKLSHTVFALPFALLAAFLAAAHAARLPTALELLLILLCMVLARTAAMAFNRGVDAPFDAANPRTAGRAVPAGRLSRRYMLAAAGVCAVGLVIASSGFWFLRGNPWPLVASPLVIAWLLGYSLSKRFTWLCHLWLGVALALSPLAAALAIEPGFLVQIDVYLLAIMVACWVAGFDIVYALQDVAADRAARLHSMPARLGDRSALCISGELHAVSMSALLALGAVNPALNLLFLFGVAAVVLLLMTEHLLVWRSRPLAMPPVFMTVNGVISLLLGGLGIVDVWRWLG